MLAVFAGKSGKIDDSGTCHQRILCMRTDSFECEQSMLQRSGGSRSRNERHAVFPPNLPTPQFSKEGVLRMHRSLFSRWLTAGPAAATIVAMSFSLTAIAREPRLIEVETPREFPFALLSDTTSGDADNFNTDPGVMGEVELVRERFADGSVNIERQITIDKDGNYVNHGGYKMFSTKGDVIAEGQYHFGRRVGTWTRWHAKNDSATFSEIPFKQFKAPFMSQVNFTDGKMDGEWIIVDANDRKVCQITLKEGLRHGMAITWLPNGSTYRQATYENGLPVGELLELNRQTGDVVRTGTYVEGRKAVTKNEYYGRGKTDKQTETTFLGPAATLQAADEFATVRFAKYASEGEYLRHGLAKAWYPNGKLEFEGTYQYGKKSGTFTFWHENGQLASTGEYREGEPDGQWVWWHENGQKARSAATMTAC
jgi:antitoxin component YwqK of YwqJK toxin-antitoxin module